MASWEGFALGIGKSDTVLVAGWHLRITRMDNAQKLQITKAKEFQHKLKPITYLENVHIFLW